MTKRHNQQQNNTDRSPELDGVMPSEGFESTKGDPFHYGKKKLFSGWKDGAYATTNVPKGSDAPKGIDFRSKSMKTQKTKNVRRSVTQSKKANIGTIIMPGGAKIMPPPSRRGKATRNPFKKKIR